METVQTDNQRMHHVHVATARFVFRHPHHGIVFVSDPISLRDAANLDLEPLLLYAVSADGAPIQAIVFSDLRSPLPLSSVLKHSWETASGLRGYPDVVVLSHGLAHAYSGLSLKLEGTGVQVGISESGDRRVAAMLREAQKTIHEIGWWSDTLKSRIRTVDDLNLLAELKHNFRMSYSGLQSSHERASRLSEWMAFEPRPLKHDVPDSMDWKPGDWLSAWSKTPVPPSRRAFRLVENAVWLEMEEEDASRKIEGDYGYVDMDDAGEKIGIVLKVWPNKASTVANAVGVTLRDLQWFIAGKIEMPRVSRSQLEDMLGVERNDESGGYEVNGPLALVGDASGPMLAAYDELTRGGDVECSLEPVPDSGRPDPSWRYLLVWPCGGLPSVLMMPRGSKAAKSLDGEEFINCSGLKVVPEAFYGDMVSACARACVSPAKNKIEMLHFAVRHLENTIARLC